MSTTSTGLLYSDVEDDLRSSVRALLRDRCAPESVVGVYDGQPPAPDLWPALGRDLGLAGLLVPEDLGGAGATAREAGVVLEELGRAAAPVPFLTGSVLAATALARVRDDRVLPKVAAGEQTAALVLPLATPPGPPGQPGGLRGSVRREAGRLHGRVTSVADAGAADLLVVPVEGSGGLELHHVDPGDGGVAVRAVPSMDMTRPLADVELDGAESVVLADDAGPAVEAALTAAAALLASEQLGVAEWCLESTVAYVRERKQFGRPVGSFQALKHRLADLWLEIASARAAARYAAGVVADHGEEDTGEVATAAALAQAYCSGVAVHAAEECVQLHGGIGMTWEHPAHLYLKRAKADEIAFGTAAMHRAALADLVDLPA
ncbi:MAG TPA: acyl-CoA dehydrogenase family protein [Nocardioidaceae bacterium]|nr:acyl-CoA dehydrogenase family protein [Nocardioidaceae bacterium]